MTDISTEVPCVSVVMSVYNGAKHLDRAVSSILSQTWTDFEFLIIDDGSTDSTPTMLAKIQKSDQRVRVITQPNTGLTRALIRGCAEARGEFIARQDADDISAPDRLSEQVALLQSDPTVGFVSCATQYVGPDDEPLEIISRDETSVEATRKLLDERQGPPAHGCVMFRRSLYEAVGGYRAEFYYGQDSDLWLRMAERALIAYSHQIYYSARRDPGSISGRMSRFQHAFGEIGQLCSVARRTNRSEQAFLEMADRLCAEINLSRDRSSTRYGQSAMAYLIGSTLQANGDPRAISYFWQAASSNPLNWRAWCRLAVSPFMNARMLGSHIRQLK